MSNVDSLENHTKSASTNLREPGARDPGEPEPGLWVLLGVGACFALSGFAALLYQTAWMRQFSLVFGTSEIAVATVLAAYMGGLALGARLIERYIENVRRPVLAYGLLEFGIAAAALSVPLLLLAAQQVMQWAIGGQPNPPSSEGWVSTAFYVLTAFIVLVLPTALMGATLPLLTRHVVRKPAQIAGRTGMLYAINTLGAVAGALVGAFLLLPSLGLNATVYVGAAVNIVVFGIAALLAREKQPGNKHITSATPARARVVLPSIISNPGIGPQWILPVMLVSGAASFIYEVLWTRLLSFVLGGSLYAFATMVASFLLGIAAGSALAAAIARTRRIAEIGFVVAQIGIALCSLAVYLAIDTLLPERAGLRGNVSLAILVLLPATLFIGATFPFAVRILTDEPRAAAAAAARTYAWNTVGAIIGAVLAGFVLIPDLRFEGTIQIAVAINALLALITCVAVVRMPWFAQIAVLVLCVLIGFLFHPAVPERLLRTSPLHVSSQGALHYYDVGKSASVVVLEQDGALMMRTNGLPEAMIDLQGTAPRFSGEFWLSPLAVVARPRIDSMLIVGYGGGVVVEGIPPSIRTVDVIELEPKVIDANRAIAGLRARDPLSDRRVQIVLNDARGALALTDKRYGAIVSQPSHPWTAGASHLYTREFMQVSRDHLTPDGVFVQWMNISFLDEELLRSLSATLLDVFGQVRIYRPDPNTLVFLASTQPLDVEQRLARSGDPLIRSPIHYARFGMRVTEDIAAALVADQEGVSGLARGADLITDDRNRMATAGAYDRGAGLTPQRVSEIMAPYDPLQRRQSWVFTDSALGLSYSYMARRMALFSGQDPGMAARLQGMSRAVVDPVDAAYVRAIALTLRGDAASGTRLLEETLTVHPDNQQVRFELTRSWLPVLARGRAPENIVAMANGLTGSAAAVVAAGTEAAAGNWPKLPPLDPALRATRWTDAWNFESIQVRTEWRTRVSNPEFKARLGREALAIIDEAIVAQPTPTMYALRARAALAADRPEALLESIASFGQTTLANLPRTNATALPELRFGVDSLIEAIDRMDTRVRAARRDAVRAQLIALRERILQAGVADTGQP